MKIRTHEKTPVNATRIVLGVEAGKNPSEGVFGDCGGRTPLREKATSKGEAMKHTVKHMNTHIDKTLAVVDNYTRQTAISCYCSECEGWEGNVRDCSVPTCPLFPYRRKTYATSNTTEFVPENGA